MSTDHCCKNGSAENDRAVARRDPAIQSVRHLPGVAVTRSDGWCPAPC